MTKLSREDYRQLGESIKIVKRNLRLILKILLVNDVDVDSFRIEGAILDKIGQTNADLSNLASSLDDNLDVDYPENVIETIGYFN